MKECFRKKLINETIFKFITRVQANYNQKQIEHQLLHNFISNASRKLC